MKKRKPEHWRKSIVRYADEDPASLLANPQNWRVHPREQTAALIGSLNEVGWIAPVIVNETTQHVVDGHARIGEAIARGEPTVPVAYVRLTEDQERLALATFDPITAMASTDQAMLDQLLAGIHSADGGLEDLLRSLASEPAKPLNDDDADLTPPSEPITQPGDLWLLGEHRLLCGDSMENEDRARLFDGGQPRLLVTDPPYGVAYDPTWRDRAQAIRLGPGRAMIPNGDEIPHDWAGAFSEDFVEVAYCWAPPGAQQYLTQQMLEAAGFEVRQQIVWVKPMAPLSRSAYHWRHEPCWYAVRKGRQADWIAGRDQTTVWEAASPTHIMSGSSEEATPHPTQKPLEVMARPIRNHSGDVYEPFLGSGTTLIAAEQLGRRCYAMEIEPAYVDVAVRRWEHVTGRKAERERQAIETHA